MARALKMPKCLIIIISPADDRGLLVVVVLVDLVLRGHVLGLLGDTVQEVAGLTLQGEGSTYGSMENMAYPTAQLGWQHWIREKEVQPSIHYRVSR